MMMTCVSGMGGAVRCSGKDCSLFAGVAITQAAQQYPSLCSGFRVCLAKKSHSQLSLTGTLCVPAGLGLAWLVRQGTARAAGAAVFHSVPWTCCACSS
jgi:hypothetical protein